MAPKPRLNFLFTARLWGRVRGQDGVTRGQLGNRSSGNGFVAEEPSFSTRGHGGTPCNGVTAHQGRLLCERSIIAPMLSPGRLLGVVALVLVGCAHSGVPSVNAQNTVAQQTPLSTGISAPSSPPMAIPAPREVRSCTEWQVVAEREFLNADERYSRLTVDRLGRPTIAAIEHLYNSSPAERLSLTMHHWDGNQWVSDTLRRFGPEVPRDLLTVPQPNGRTGVLLRDKDSSYVFQGPPWVETSLSISQVEPLGAASDSDGNVHLLLLRGGSLLYATGRLDALDVRLRIPIVSSRWAYVRRFVVSPRGTRFSIKLEADNDMWLVEGEPFSPQSNPPTVQRVDDNGWKRYEYGRFGADDDGSRYDMFDRTPFSDVAVVQRAGSSRITWSWPHHKPYQLSDEERRCAPETGPPPRDKSRTKCVLPAATFTLPVVVPVVVPPAMRGVAGPSVIALGERDPLADKLGYREAICSNDRGPEGWFRSVSPSDGRLVVTGLYDEEPRVRSQVMPTSVGRILAHTASVQIDAYGRVHALFGEQRFTDQQTQNTRVHYVLLGCGQ